MPKVTATSSSSSSKKAKVVPTSNCKKEIDKIDNSDDVSCSTHFRDPCCKQSVHFSDDNMPPLLPKAFADKLLLQLKQHAGEGLIEDCLSLEVLKEGLEAEPDNCYNCVHLFITQRPLTFDEVGPYPTAYDPEMPWYMIAVTDWSVPRKGFGYVNGCANCMTLKTVVKQFDGCIITCHENPSIPASTFGQCSFVRRDLKPPVKYNRFDAEKQTGKHLNELSLDSLQKRKRDLVKERNEMLNGFHETVFAPLKKAFSSEFWSTGETVHYVLAFDESVITDAKAQLADMQVYIHAVRKEIKTLEKKA